MGHLRAPNGKLIVGTCDLVPATAEIQAVHKNEDGTLDLEWAGGSKMHWDGQYTEKMPSGEDVYIDEAGNQWAESKLTFHEEDVDG